MLYQLILIVPMSAEGDKGVKDNQAHISWGHCFLVFTLVRESFGETYVKYTYVRVLMPMPRGLINLGVGFALFQQPNSA